MINRILKHKIPKYVSPWERGFSAWEKPDADSLESRHYRAHVSTGAFQWMVYWCINGKFNLEETINSYWRQSTRDEFPTEGGNAYDLCLSILRNLIITGHRKNRVELKDGEVDAFPSMWNEFRDKLKSIHINKENTMAKKKFVDLAEEPKGKSKVQSDPGGPRMTLKRQASVRCFELLMEEQHTDQEIIETIIEELDYKFIPSMITRRRKMLNEGEAVDFGFETPDHVIEEIGGDTEGTTKVAIAKKSPLKPAKKKAIITSGLKKPLPVKKFTTKKFTTKKFTLKKKPR